MFVVVGVPLTIVLGAGRGARRSTRAWSGSAALFRVGFYLPVVTSIVAIAVVWRFLLEPDVGSGQPRCCGLVGIDGPNWLGNTSTALPSLIVMTAWRNFGFLMVIFLAGLQAIPQELYEAATHRRRRAGGQQFRHVTLPLLRPTLLFGTVVIGSIGLSAGLRGAVRDDPGRAARQRRCPSSYHIYNQFGFGNYGYASAMSYVLFVAIVALSVLQFRLLRETRMADSDEPAPGTVPPQRCLHVVLVAGLLVVVAPFVWMLLSSFKPRGRDPSGPPTWLPDDLDPGQLPRPVRPARLPALLRQLGARRRRW